MMESELQPINITPEPEYTVPWKPIDNWIGIGLLILVNVLLLVLAVQGIMKKYVENAGIIVIQLVYLIPLIVIFLYRGISIKALGVGKFKWGMLALGCGLVAASYMIVIVHNVIISLLGIDTQGEEVFQLLGNLNSPIWFVIVGVIFAPLIEEAFFRGFLFQGFRAHYGWVKGAIISAVIFGAVHLDPVAFIPAVVLGFVLAYIYHRTNSIWPGVILHFLINGFGFLSYYILTQIPGGLPTG